MRESSNADATMMSKYKIDFTPRSLLAILFVSGAALLIANARAKSSRTLGERPWPPETCIAILQDADPLNRSYAIDDLLLAPEESIDCIVRQAESGDERTIEVCMELLVEFWYVEDRDVWAKAIDALLELRESETQATAVMARHYLLNHQRQVGECCCEALEAKGAVIHRFALLSSNEEHLIPGSVVLGPRWCGSLEDLAWIRRLPHSIRLYLVDGDELGPAGSDYLREVRPDLVIRRRGPACLGVTFRGGLHIRLITPESPADLAGIEASSRLVALNGQVVRDFEHLLDLMIECTPGQEVQLTIYQHGQFREVPLRLGSDVETGVCECVNEPVETTRGPHQDQAQPTPRPSGEN